LCSRFGLMHKGRLVSEGTLAELRERTGCRGLLDMFLHLAHLGPALGRSSEFRADGDFRMTKIETPNDERMPKHE
jgi:hypothetical protein